MASVWFRCYTEIKRDRKLRRLPIAHRWIWVVLMAIAKESPSEGRLLLSEDLPITVDDIADEAAVDVEEVEQAIERFKEQNMIHEEDGVYVLTNWDDRQFVSDTSTERVRKYRQRKKETLLKRSGNDEVTPPDTETETDTETEKDIRLCPNSASSDDDCPPDEKQKPSKKYGEEHMQLAEHLKSQILANKPDARVPDNLDSWADTFRLMVERDGRSCQQIAAVIDWCQSDDFWMANILSANKLREKFDQLELQMQRAARADPREKIPRAYAGLMQMREEIEERERKRGSQPSRAGPS
jgi:predicted phage replisome organizer